MAAAHLRAPAVIPFDMERDLCAGKAAFDTPQQAMVLVQRRRRIRPDCKPFLCQRCGKIHVGQGYVESTFNEDRAVAELEKQHARRRG